LSEEENDLRVDRDTDREDLGQSGGMKHFLSSFALSLGLVVPVLAACSGNVADDPAPANDGSSTSSAGTSEDVGTVDSEVKSGKKKKSCASVGGSCVGLSPSSCAGGHWADASKISCGPGIGAGCCVRPSPKDCPELVQPPPGFCTGGKIVPVHDATTGCTTGFDCVPSATNACTAAGGTCVGLAPSSCAAGHWADATTHSCGGGGGIGVGCCMP
jgi:hypothetical protein